MFGMIVNLVLSGLDAVVKNPAKKAQFKDKLVQIAAVIVAHYGQEAVLEAAAQVKNN